MSSPSLTGSTAVASPALSVASWSAIDDVYQVNIIAAQQVIEDFLNSPHNTWNYPSPDTSPATHSRRSPTPSIPFSPVPIVAPSFVFPDPSVTPPNFLHVLADLAEQELRAPDVEVKLEPLDSPVLEWPAEEQDEYAHGQFEDPVDRVPLADIPVENLPPPIVEAPVQTVPSPRPTPVVPRPLADQLEYFPQFFTAPPCTTATDHHPHQYTVVYDRGEKVWVAQDEYLVRDFVNLFPKYTDLSEHPDNFVTPFCSHLFHEIQLAANGPLPNVYLCAKVGHHPHSLHFPFGYIESSFVDSIKFLFGQFPRGWLEYFEGALVPLASYDFLDGRIATLVGRLHFTPDGIFVIDRHTRTEDLLRTHLHLAAFVCTPRVPTRPFLHITPPPVEEPL